MKKRNRAIALFVVVIILAVCMATCFAGCDSARDSRFLNRLADNVALTFVLGNDALDWNTFFVNPQKAYDYVQNEDSEWYSYSSVDSEILEGLADYLKVDKLLMRNVNPSKLGSRDKATYRALEAMLNQYTDFYGSRYAKDFVLIGGSYISSEGGYVAEFSTSVENFIFRTEADVKTLLSITSSTDEAFATYLDFARDRINAGYPLYDYTLNEMQSYLDDVLALGEDYYLYAFINKKLDAAEFLSETSRQKYKADYKKALTEDFMKGVRDLRDGLDAYKGRVTTTQKSYLEAYGEVGRAYYQWRFESITGMRGANIAEVYNELLAAYRDVYAEYQQLREDVEALADTDRAAYDEFYEYVRGDKVYLGLTDPQDMIDYLKVVSKNIVPDLRTEPQIEFKYLDETVEERSNLAAYYLKSPLDEENSVEHITINRYAMNRNPSGTLKLLAHEGYPGHLYANVNAKESKPSLLTSLFSSLAFSEGWANYVELALLNQIAADSESKAVKLYAQYDAYILNLQYYDAVLTDMDINYFGSALQDYMDRGYTQEEASQLIERNMEMPAVYVSYGYGMYFMSKLHEEARTALNDAYDEAEFNGMLLSDGFAVTLERAEQMTDEYIANKR